MLANQYILAIIVDNVSFAYHNILYSLITDNDRNLLAIRHIRNYLSSIMSMNVISSLLRSRLPILHQNRKTRPHQRCWYQVLGSRYRVSSPQRRLENPEDDGMRYVTMGGFCVAMDTNKSLGFFNPYSTLNFASMHIYGVCSVTSLSLIRANDSRPH